MWDPGQYARFSDERSRPFHDLLGRVFAPAPRYVVDVGCGSGELTALLARRWPEADVDGVDSSAEMLARAPTDVPRLSFIEADATDWRPERAPDLVVSNAALQWVPGHEQVVRDLAAALAPGGWLALQVPGNFDAPSHVLLRETASRWLPGLDLRRAPVLDPAGYATLLGGCGLTVDAWETTYLQLLHGQDPVLEWMRGTALRPVLAELPAAEQPGFLAEYGAALRTAYPAGPHGTALPFRRVFAVGRGEDTPL
ncbi:MAG: methyltransferase domain-containing protein [Geodermatophilaceae bacterium]|nr:methyltransferase domain-containing protein [Geodermatophilaceae bacterium]